jgi:transposase InsO family protein
LIVDRGWPPARAAERYDVAWKTAKKWADRYRAEGPAGMLDRSSAPHHQPNRTPASVVRKIVHLRWKQRLGPIEIGDRLGVPSSTVHAVLVRCRLNRLSHIDRATGEPIRRYEHDRPGDLIHVDVKKLGKVPDGGGWRYVGRQQGDKNGAATALRTGLPKSKYRQPLVGTCYLHTVIDDHSRVAYVEAREDETKETATEVLRNAVAWFADRGVTVKRVLSDNGSCYKSYLWRETCAELGIVPKKTRPYRPQTNGKIERFHRTLVEGWASKSSTTPNQPDSPLCQHGSTCTTTTGPTQQSGSSHPSAGWTTCLGITPSAARNSGAVGSRMRGEVGRWLRSVRCATSSGGHLVAIRHGTRSGRMGRRRP